MVPDVNPKSVKRRAMALAIIGIMGGGIALYYAASGEMSGKTYKINTQDKHTLFVSVTRDEAPADFRHANNAFWAISIFSFGIGAAGIWHYWDLNKL